MRELWMIVENIILKEEYGVIGVGSGESEVERLG